MNKLQKPRKSRASSDTVPVPSQPVDIAGTATNGVLPGRRARFYRHYGLFCKGPSYTIAHAECIGMQSVWSECRTVIL